LFPLTDHDGDAYASALPPMSFAKPVPSALTRPMLVDVPSSYEKAMRVPSGEKTVP